MAKNNQNIAHAFWESKDTGLVILSEDWSNTTTVPPLFLGPLNLSFKKIERLPPQECGRYCRYYRHKNSWVFAIRSNRYPQLLDRKVRVYLGGEFNDWEQAIGQTEWELKPVSQVAETTYEVRVPIKLIPEGRVLAFKFITEEGDWLDVPDSAPNSVLKDGVANFTFNPAQTGHHIFRYHTPEGYEPIGNEKIVWREAKQEEVHELPHTQFLLAAKTDLELGSIVENGTTTFRLFAPRANSVEVFLGEMSMARMRSRSRFVVSRAGLGSSSSRKIWTATITRIEWTE